MIPYEQLVQSLVKWRMDRGLPVTTSAQMQANAVGNVAFLEADEATILTDEATVMTEALPADEATVMTEALPADEATVMTDAVPADEATVTTNAVPPSDGSQFADEATQVADQAWDQNAKQMIVDDAAGGKAPNVTFKEQTDEGEVRPVSSDTWLDDEASGEFGPDSQTVVAEDIGRHDTMMASAADVEAAVQKAQAEEDTAPQASDTIDALAADEQTVMAEAVSDDATVITEAVADPDEETAFVDAQDGEAAQVEDADDLVVSEVVEEIAADDLIVEEEN